MTEGIWINDREYYFYEFKDNKYILVTNFDEIYDRDILEIELLNDNIRMRLRRFDKKVIQFVGYINELDDSKEFKYYSKQKQNFYAGEFEQKDYYYISLFKHINEQGEETILKLKRDGSRPFKFKETKERYVFVDIDGDEFKITARAIGEAKLLAGFIIPSIPRIKDFIKNINGKQKSLNIN